MDKISAEKKSLFCSENRVLNLTKNLYFQPLVPTSSENMDYADADYKDIYDFGPVSYTQGSKEAAAKKNEKGNGANKK